LRHVNGNYVMPYHKWHACRYKR